MSHGSPQTTQISGEGTSGETPGHLLFCSPAVTDLLIPGDLSLCWQSGPLGGLAGPPRMKALRVDSDCCRHQ